MKVDIGFFATEQLTESIARNRDATINLLSPCQVKEEIKHVHSWSASELKG